MYKDYTALFLVFYGHVFIDVQEYILHVCSIQEISNLDQRAKD